MEPPLFTLAERILRQGNKVNCYGAPLLWCTATPRRFIVGRKPLSEARGLWLWRTGLSLSRFSRVVAPPDLRGGIACNMRLGAEAQANLIDLILTLEPSSSELCRCNCWGSKFTPFFHMIKVMVTIFRVGVRRAIVGPHPFGNQSNIDVMDRARTGAGRDDEGESAGYAQRCRS